MSVVERLEKQREGAKALIEQRGMANRLLQNADFRKLILEEYMVNEAARYVQLSADPALGAENRADALAMAQATGHLKRWIDVQEKMANQAEVDLVSLDEMIEEARAEEDAK